MVGIILFKTGLLAKGFDKLNKFISKGIDKNLKDISDRLDQGTVSVSGQSEAVKKLGDSYADVAEQVIKLQNKIKGAFLTAGIRSEARQVFTTFVDGFTKVNNQLIDIEKELEQTRADIAKRQLARNEELIKSAQDTVDAFNAMFDAPMAGPNPFVTTERPTGRRVGQEELEAAQAILDKSNELNAILLKEKNLQEKITEIRGKAASIIQEQVKLARVQLQRQLDGTQAITDEFNLRRALVEEETRNARTLVTAFKLQTVEAEKQEALLRNNVRLREESISKIDLTIEKAREFGLGEEAINDLVKDIEDTV